MGNYVGGRGLGGVSESGEMERGRRRGGRKSWRGGRERKVMVYSSKFYFGF